MAERANTLVAAQGRMRALIVPREHGAWGLLLIPLFTGVAAGITSGQRTWPTVVFTVVALSLFWLRTPVESLLGTGPMRAHNRQEQRVALMASLCLATVALACLAVLLWHGQNLELLVFGSIAAIAFVLQSILRRLGRKTRMTAQFVGAIGLTSTAPAGYYLATGHLNQRALALWIANWVFAENQIHFVQLRIHAARALKSSERFAKGRLFLLTQLTALAALALATLFRWIPLLMILAFVPAFIRGTHWFFQHPRPLDIKSLGWSEMKQGAAFGTLLAIAFILT